MVKVCSGGFVSWGSSNLTAGYSPGHGSPVSTITPPEIVVPSLKLGGLRDLFALSGRPLSLIPFLEFAVQQVAARAWGSFHLSLHTTEMTEAGFGKSA